MSILFGSDYGWIISHLDYLHSVYEFVENDHENLKLKFNEKFFKVNSQYLRQNQIIKCKTSMDTNVSSLVKRKRRKNVHSLPQNILEQNNFVKRTGEKLMKDASNRNLFTNIVLNDNNEESRLESKNFYIDRLDPVCNYQGSNERETAIIANFKDEKYVFPKNCKFFCYDVRQMSEKFQLTGNYNLILMDPPWWNKSIRRKKVKFEESSYKMLYNEELTKIPIKSLLSSNGIVAIWCTNSPSNEKSILEEMFLIWGLTFVAKWYWLKVTQNGDVICDFSDTHGKQPYEQIIFGTVTSNKNIKFPDRKVLISIPSSVHSHKPPLAEILKPYLPKNPKCMEIFARYLLPQWTSWGLEVLKFQHLSLFSSCKTDNKECLVPE